MPWKDPEVRRRRDRARIAALRAAARAERAASAAELRAIDAARFGVDPEDDMALLLARWRAEADALPELLERQREQMPRDGGLLPPGGGQDGRMAGRATKRRPRA